MDPHLIVRVARVVAVIALLLLWRPLSMAAYGTAAIALCLVLVPDTALARRAPTWRRQPQVVERSDFATGYALLRSGRPADAEPHLRRAIAANGTDADARLNLGIALSDSGRHAEAIVELEEAARLRPRDAVAHYRLGVAFDAAGRRFAAIHALREAVRLDPRLDAAERALASASSVTAAGHAPAIGGKAPRAATG